MLHLTADLFTPPGWGREAGDPTGLRRGARWRWREWRRASKTILSRLRVRRDKDQARLRVGKSREVGNRQLHRVQGQGSLRNCRYTLHDGDNTTDF